MIHGPNIPGSYAILLFIASDFTPSPITSTKVENETYTHLNAEFQRIARRDKKAFLSDQCKEIEENNRMGKTRDLFKKIMSTIKDKNGMDLTGTEDKRRGGKNTQNYAKKIFMTQIITMV